MMNSEYRRIEFFKRKTEDRISELEGKKERGTLTRSEEFEYDMCRADLERATKKLQEKAVTEA